MKKQSVVPLVLVTLFVVSVAWGFARVDEPPQGSQTSTVGRYAVSASAEATVLVDTANGKTWLLHCSTAGDAPDACWAPITRFDDRSDSFEWLLRKQEQLEKSRSGTRVGGVDARTFTLKRSRLHPRSDLEESLRSSQRDYIFCATSYLAKAGGPALVSPLPDSLEAWQRIGGERLKWLKQQEAKDRARLEYGFPAFVETWSPYYPPIRRVN